MTNVLSKLFGDIAQAIRNKTGATNKIAPIDFPSQIDSITVGGGGGSAEGFVTVTFMNGNTEIFSRPVYIGDDCPDPVTQGRIETPTKESTVDTVFTYSGWTSVDGGTASNSVLNKITEDTVVYSAFTESVRYYTINFYDGETLLNTEQVAYGGTSSYTHKKDNYLFNGWTPEPTNVTSDMNCYGGWEESYSFADASWEYIARMSESGRASEAFAVGDERVEKIGSYTVTLVIADFNYDLLAGNSGKTAGITIITKDVYGGIGVYAYGTDWINSPIYTKLIDIFNGFSIELTAKVKSVRKKYREAKTSQDKVYSTNEKIWALSAGEVVNKDSYSGIELDERSQDRVYAYFNTLENIYCSKKWWTRTWQWNDDDYVGLFEANKSNVIPGYVHNTAGIRFGFCI